MATTALHSRCKEGSALLRPILLVEDDALIRLSTAMILEEAGYTVAPFATADAAWEWLRLTPSPKPWALLTDVQMPGEMDGLKLAKAVHAVLPAIQVIIVSGRVALHPSTLPFRSATVSKPFSPHMLLSTVGKLASAVGQLTAKKNGP